jgi:hypothetical protein
MVESSAMDPKSAQIATICGCIDHCFAFALWCDDFVQHVDPDDMMMGLDRAFDLMSDATRLQSFLALRKLDDFLRGTKSKKDDLIAEDLGVDVPTVLGNVGQTLLTADERENVNKGVAHLTDKLTLDPDSEVELDAILKRSTDVLSRLVAELRKADTKNEAKHWLDQTDQLIKRVREIQARRAAELAAMQGQGVAPA